MRSIALLTTGLLALSATAFATPEPIATEFTKYAQEGAEWPVVTFTPRIAGTMNVRINCGGRFVYTLETDIDPGAKHEVVLEQLPRGMRRCGTKIEYTDTNGQSGVLGPPVEVEVLPKLQLDIPGDQVDLRGHAFFIKSDRPLTHIEVKAYGNGGAVIGQVDKDMSGNSANITWKQTVTEEAVKLDIWATEEIGLVTHVAISPWTYQIPHDDVVFTRGGWDIATGEVRKLDPTWVELRDIEKKYGSVMPVNLYVTAYTDTVGDAQNNQIVSEKRAREIGRWFRKRGFSGKVYFQGFGEAAQGVSTGDNVDEPRNNRTVFIVSAQHPQPSNDIPKSDWKKLD